MGYFQVRYNSRVINYEHKMFIRLATGLLISPLPFNQFTLINVIAIRVRTVDLWSWNRILLLLLPLLLIDLLNKPFFSNYVNKQVCILILSLNTCSSNWKVNLFVSNNILSCLYKHKIMGLYSKAVMIINKIICTKQRDRGLNCYGQTAKQATLFNQVS